MKRRKAAWRELSEFLGPTTPLFKVTRSEINRFRDELLEAPARAGSISELKALSFPQRVQAIRATPGKYKKLDLNSVGDRLRQINAVFEFAVSRGDLDRNPAQGVSEGKRTSNKARDFYKDAELQLIFSTTPFDRPLPVDQQTDEYWVPLLELFLGARASELYLRTSDVVLDHDIPHLRLVEYDQRTLKNASSARALPIHPQLMEIGFLDFCRLAKTRGGELFPTWEFRKDQKPSEGAGRRRFNKHLRKLLPDRGGFPADSHTFRHNFESALASAFAPADSALSHSELVELNRVVARLSGRAFRGSASTYTHDLAILPEMAEKIAKVRYRGLSLKHLVPT
jgi:site-specific recombinase XerC